MLLGVWCFPAVSFAESLRTPTAEVGSPASGSAPAQPSTRTEAQSEESALAAREKQSPDLQNFTGGAVVYIGGATLILVILLLILIV